MYPHSLGATTSPWLVALLSVDVVVRVELNFEADVETRARGVVVAQQHDVEFAPAPVDNRLRVITVARHVAKQKKLLASILPRVRQRSVKRRRIRVHVAHYGVPHASGKESRELFELRYLFLVLR